MRRTAASPTTTRTTRAARGLALTVTSVALAASTMAPAVADEQRREVYVGPAGDDSVASPLPVRATVVDGLKDAKGRGNLHRYADLRKVSYRTPSVREGGTMTVRVRWRDLVRPGRGVRQILHTLVDARTDKSRPFSYATISPGPRFELYVITDADRHGAEPVRPDDFEVVQQPGRDRTVITMSTEWLDAERVRVYTHSSAEDPDLFDAYDSTRGARLRVGPAPAAD